MIVYLKNDSSYQGLLYSFDPTEVNFIILSNPKIFIKEKNEFKYIDESKLKIDTSEISFMNIVHKKLKKYSKGDFQTDVDISKKTYVKLNTNKNSLIQ